jgi:sensor histidine kinase YesM
MRQYPFIFSTDLKYRLQRHLLFWFSWWLFCTFLYSFTHVPKIPVSYLTRVQHTGIEAFFYLFAHVFLAYTLMYVVVPKYLVKKRYVQSLIITVFLVFMTALISVVIGTYILMPLLAARVSEHIQTTSVTGSLYFAKALMAGLRGSITIGGFAAAIKLMKHLYLKDQKNLELQKQNINSQLQLLKAQVHPHFLFNTLNNIYSHTQVASPEAPRMVAGLSDLLRYMLYECNQQLVPLKKEFKMLKDYILLEQLRYNHQLDLSVSIPEDDENLLIAPLLLLPFVENCFKHGTSQVLEHPWVSLTISLQNSELKMKLVNGTAIERKKSLYGIGIKNVRQRLELLYPEKHQLKISETEDAFIVSLTIQLEGDRVAILNEKELLHVGI